MTIKQLNSLPANVYDLLDILDEVYPEKAASLTWTDREIFYKAGQRSVVNWLLELKRREDNPD